MNRRGQRMAGMVGSFLRRSTSLAFLENPIISKACNVYSQAFRVLDEKNAADTTSIADKPCNGLSGSGFASSDCWSMMHLSPLLPSGRDKTEVFDIELVDPGPWQVSSSIVHAWREMDQTSKTSNSLNEIGDGMANHSEITETDADFDEIEDMRLRGNLFYKLDRSSREFEEYNVNFRRKHSPKKNKDKHDKPMLGKESNNKEELKKDKEKRSKEIVRKETTGKEKSGTNTASKQNELANHKKNLRMNPEPGNLHNNISNVSGTQMDGKKTRSPTYNQLTGPYHEPFCLDIYISKSSVRACIVHRVTSKVVAVAHSISKDLKHDLVSTKDSAACAAVGGVLAQRAISDDIHDVVYTPRKGEKLEGKLQVVLQSIIDNGINVKVKLKQRKAIKATA